MKTLYADDTYLRSTKDDAIPRIHLLGGLIIADSDEAALISKVREIKERYTHKNMPLKWNMRDDSIRRTYEKLNRMNEYEAMVSESYVWRKDLATAISDSPISLLVSCIEAYSEDREIVKGKKPELLRFLFENVLLQLSFDASDSSDRWACVLDWPPNSDAQPFDQAYYHLFHEGRTLSNVTSKNGALESLGFIHSPLYARCNHSPLLQLADVVVGATREHIEAVIQNRPGCLGSEVVTIIRKKFRCSYEGRIPGYGVVVSGGSTHLKAHVDRAFQ